MTGDRRVSCGGGAEFRGVAFAPGDVRANLRGTEVTPSITSASGLRIIHYHIHGMIERCGAAAGGVWRAGA